MRALGFFMLGLGVIACNRRDDSRIESSSEGAPDTPATSTSASKTRVAEPRRPADSTAGLARGVEPGAIPAIPTPTVTTEASLTAMRAHLQRLDSASAEDLQAKVSEHTRRLGDLLTTMRVEVQAATSPRKEQWMAAADAVEGELNKLTLSRGEELRTAFRTHRTRVLKLLDDFRALVPSP